MNEKSALINRLILLTALSLICTNSANTFAEPSINKNEVSTYLRRNKDGPVEYDCESPDSDCSVICSSGGNDYIDAKGVVRAFHGERKSSVNGAVTGYYLVVDVDESSGNRDIWAVLQLESSCLFRGMKPDL